MFRSASRVASRRLAAAPTLQKINGASRRFLSTAPPAEKSRSWKNSAVRWALAAGVVYYYNTSSVFAEQPEEAIAQVDQKLHQIQEDPLPTIDAIVEERRRRQAEEESKRRAEQQALAASSAAPTEASLAGAEESQITHDAPAHDDSEEGPTVEELEAEAGQQGAFNPETGEINWDCPCLGGMAHGPCGEEFKAAFSCFVYSKEEPKGVECIDKFKHMQDCFRQHPEMYGSELEDDEDEVEEELRARETQGGALESTTAGPETVLGQSQPAPTADHAHHDAQDGPAQNGKAGIAQFNGDEGGELVPRGEHVSSHPNQKTTGKTA